MATYSPALDSPTLRGVDQDDTPSKTQSPSNGSRQTRRLQLRNAGFRGAALPTRKVTPPKSISSSTWSSVSGTLGASDVENMSPSGTRVGSACASRRESSGILQEIGNTTVSHRPKKARHRVSSSKDFGTDTVRSGLATSPPPLKSTIRRHSIRSKPKVAHRKRSVSAEASKYIEHLEAELAATQSQLSSVTSPSVTREQSSKMRTLNVETRQLQEELTAWETKYEHRVQEEVDRHLVIETDMKARIRNLEQDAEDAKYQIQELETALQSTTQNMQAVEVANTNLEKRLEIMSELLASSKVDLHAETPGRGRKHVRPKSMLPRFPTASSLMGSPERQPRTQPTSPLFTFAQRSPGIPDSPSHSDLLLDSSPDHTDFASEVESIFSEDSIAGDSMTSAENFDSVPNFNPWSLPPRQNSATKPARRMRRFGAGSLGPKPLILPSTSQYDLYPPTSAPPLEHSRTTPAFFPIHSTTLEDKDTTISGRRRASTTANEMTLADPLHSPFLETPEPAFGDESMVSLTTPPSVCSLTTTRRYSSIESTAGRNLMDELTAARSEETEESGEQIEVIAYADVSTPSGLAQSTLETGLETMTPAAESMQDLQPTQSCMATVGSPASSTTSRTHHRTLSRSTSIPVLCSSNSIFDRLRILFGDLWRSPVAVARYLIQTAQARMRIPRTLLNVQWWLVGVLLGPMAKRRILTASVRGEDLEEQPLLLEDTQRREQSDGGLAYGTLDQFSPTLRTSGGTCKGRRRAGSKMRCVHRRAKHSPWLWIKFSITLAFAIGAAFKDGPGSLLRAAGCKCRRREESEVAERSSRRIASC